MLIHPPGNRLFRRQIGGRPNVRSMRDLQHVEVDRVRRCLIEDDTDGVAGNDMVQLTRQHTQQCPGIALRGKHV